MYENSKASLGDGLALIRLNSSTQLNALNGTRAKEMIEAAEKVETNPWIDCIAMTGDDDIFVEGTDTSEMAGVTASVMSSTNGKRYNTACLPQNALSISR